jgi:hypothetical protein
MYNRYPQQQRKKNTQVREASLYEALGSGQLDQYADRRVPLPDSMSKPRDIEEAVRSLGKVLLGAFDAKWGLDGSMPPMRGRW